MFCSEAEGAREMLVKARSALRQDIRVNILTNTKNK